MDCHVEGSNDVWLPKKVGLYTFLQQQPMQKEKCIKKEKRNKDQYQNMYVYFYLCAMFPFGRMVQLCGDASSNDNNNNNKILLVVSIVHRDCVYTKAFACVSSLGTLHVLLL